MSSVPSINVTVPRGICCRLQCLRWQILLIPIGSVRKMHVAATVSHMVEKGFISLKRMQSIASSPDILMAKLNTKTAETDHLSHTCCSVIWLYASAVPDIDLTGLSLHSSTKSIDCRARRIFKDADASRYLSILNPFYRNAYLHNRAHTTCTMFHRGHAAPD